MGRKPDPTALKLLKGARKDRINPNEPKPMARAPAKPDWLTKAAAEEWDRLVPELVRIGVIKSTDGQACVALCWLWGEFVRLVKFLNRRGFTHLTPNKHRQPKPELGMARETLKLLKSMWPEFGLTPSSRQNIVVDGEHTTSDMEKMLEKTK